MCTIRVYVSRILLLYCNNNVINNNIIKRLSERSRIYYLNVLFFFPRSINADLFAQLYTQYNIIILRFILNCEFFLSIIGKIQISSEYSTRIRLRIFFLRRILYPAACGLYIVCTLYIYVSHCSYTLYNILYYDINTL